MSDEPKTNRPETSSQVRGRFTFLTPDAQIGEPFDGDIHLFVREYDEDLTFWYGYAHIQCTWADFQAAVKASGGPGTMHVCVAVDLEDGRSGITNIVHFKNDLETLQSMYFGLVGCTTLRNADEQTIEKTIKWLRHGE
jgi:hypothetical protein